MKMPISEDKLSLSIIFCFSKSSSISSTSVEDHQVLFSSSNILESLDLVIPSHHDLELLITTLKHLINFHREYYASVQNSILMMQYFWTEFGKPLCSTLGQSEWVSLCCDHLSVPISRSAASSLFKIYCKINEIKVDSGIPMLSAIDALQYAHHLSLFLLKSSDPRDDLWYKTIKDQNIIHMKKLDASTLKVRLPDSLRMRLKFENMFENDDGTKTLSKARVLDLPLSVKMEDDYLSAEAFLSFLQQEQKDNHSTLSDVHNLFERLNSQVHPSQLSPDGLTKRLSSSNSSNKGKVDKHMFSKYYISKSTFFNYLLSDLNDAFDPKRGEAENDDMSLPLTCYWINSSHDTYLACASSPMTSQIKTGTAKVDVSMYSYALNRGCRSLEVDVWDGSGHQMNEPVVRSGATKNANSGANGILFSDVITVIHSFLKSNTSCLPIILMIESHCSTENQDKMADILLKTLEEDDMLYLPRKNKNRILPSPDKLRGKLVLRFKHPQTNSPRIFYDDYDDLNDVNPFDKNQAETHSVAYSKDFSDVDAYLMRALNIEKKSPEQITQDLSELAKQAIRNAEAADAAALDAKLRLNRAKELASLLLSRAGLTEDFFERKEQQKFCQSVQKPTKSKKHEDATTVVLTPNYGRKDIQFNFTESNENENSSKDEDAMLNKLILWANNMNGLDSLEEERQYVSDCDDSSSESREDSVMSKFTRTEFHDDHEAELPQQSWLKALGFSIKQTFSPPTHGSLMEVERQLKAMELFEMDTEAGIEVQRYYSASLDAILRDQEHAEEQQSKAAKQLAEKLAFLKQVKEEYMMAKQQYDHAEKSVTSGVIIAA